MTQNVVWMAVGGGAALVMVMTAVAAFMYLQGRAKNLCQNLLNVRHMGTLRCRLQNGHDGPHHFRRFDQTGWWIDTWVEREPEELEPEGSSLFQALSKQGKQ